MRILTLLNGQTSQEVLQVESPICGLLFRLGGVDADASVEVVHVSKSGSNTIIPRMPIRQAAAMGNVDGYETVPAEDSATHVHFLYVPIVDSGALDTNDGYLTVRVNKLSATTGDVFGLESFGKSNKPYTYDVIHLNANTPKEVNVAGHVGLILDLNSLSAVELRLINGERVRYEREEFRFLVSAIYEKIPYNQQITGAQVYSIGRYAGIRIEDIVSVIVTQTALTTMVVVR